MGLGLEEREFIEKYGFAINDLNYACIEDICRRSHWCCTVKELAYDIENQIYRELNEEYEDSNILYKLEEIRPFNTKIYNHNVAIPYKDFYFVFEIGWVGNSLSVKDWDLKPEEEINTDKKYTDIETAFPELEEEEEQ